MPETDNAQRPTPVAVERVVGLLRSRGPMLAGEIGAELWLPHGLRYADDASRRYCRAAGVILKRAQALGLVRDEQRGRRRLWIAREANSVLSATESQNPNSITPPAGAK